MGLFGERTGSSWFLEQNMNSFWNMRHSWSFHVLSQWVCLKIQYYFFHSILMFEMNMDVDIQSRPKNCSKLNKAIYSAKYWSSPKSVWLSPSSQPSKHPTWILITVNKKMWTQLSANLKSKCLKCSNRQQESWNCSNDLHCKFRTIFSINPELICPYMLVQHSSIISIERQ